MATLTPNYFELQRPPAAHSQPPSSETLPVPVNLLGTDNPILL